MPGKLIRLPGKSGLYYRRKRARKNWVMAKDPRYRGTNLENKKFRFQKYDPSKDRKRKYTPPRRPRGYKPGYAHTQDKGRGGW